LKLKRKIEYQSENLYTLEELDREIEGIVN